IWQTVDQKIVSDYGLLEEFVFRVTDIVPQLLSTRQRAELIMGLRARLILELCRCEDTAQIQIIQPHLDRMQELESHFMALVKNLLRDSDERRNFFNDVFPGDFGPTYDKAIQTLMWLFLTRLEKLLPTQSLQQVKGFVCVFDCHFYSLFVESGILSALCLPSEERMLIVSAQTEADSESGVAYTICSEMEVESDDKVYVAPGSCEDAVNAPWVDLGNECSAEFKCRQTFRFHLRNICYDEQQVDPEKTEDDKHCFKCDQCDKAFKYKSTLDSHKQTHNPLYCHACMKLVRDSDALALHKESHTPFQCNHCEENFPVFKALHKHYVDVHNPTEPYTCAHCQTTFVSLKRFIRHEWKHTGYQPFQCPQCVKRFRSYSDLVEHQRKHTKAYPYLCWECGKKFRHSLTLTRHVARVHHSGEPVLEKPAAAFGCLQCGKMFTSRRCLLKHDNFHHKGLRFPCEFCGKGFFGKDALVRHTLIHTGERPFKCDDCEKSFRSLAELKIHRRYHTGERPFKCTVCQKGFVQSCFLTLHMRSHTGERPYVCAVCSKGFTSLHGLKRHRRLIIVIIVICHDTFVLTYALQKHVFLCRGPTLRLTLRAHSFYSLIILLSGTHFKIPVKVVFFAFIY
uniref:C2H2-type domain-containing protein n=1 Tax=Periophthalmus magnuspinnatus TaxID=409849 RepID=A0A3B4B5A3_9GOBI